MENQNVCLFVPYHKDYESIHTVNFVLETKPQCGGAFRTDALYKVHLVCSGHGILHTMGNVCRLSAGDVFFTFAGTPYSIESEENFTYQYISFLGARANQIMEKLGISPSDNYFTDCGSLLDFWRQGLDVNPAVTDLISESVLLYTFSFLGSRLLSKLNEDCRIDETFLTLKKYIDDNINSPKLSLASAAAELNYHPKYLSALFKRRVGIGIAEYTNVVRVQNACTLMEQGLRSIGEIAAISGFRDALYFSKVFKKKMGFSPKAYLSSMNQKSKTGK